MNIWYLGCLISPWLKYEFKKLSVLYSLLQPLQLQLNGNEYFALGEQCYQYV